jgi:hypothetical protein
VKFSDIEVKVPNIEADVPDIEVKVLDIEADVPHTESLRLSASSA